MEKTFRAVTIRANSYDEDTHTIALVWTTGAAVRRVDYRGEEYDEVLSLDPGAVDLNRLNAGAPLLDSHQSYQVANIVGAIVPGSAKIEDGRGTAKVQLSKAADVADIVGKIIEGTARNISVGYWIESSVRTDGDPPVVTVTRWTPMEVSIVPVSADSGSQIRSANGRRRSKQRQTPMQRGAAEATRLLQSTQTRAEAHGAAEARKLTSGTSAHRQAIARGARAARKLLKGKS
ncbi:MAG: hypothetical protein WDN29_02770 [Methylovirgula sp.]